MARTGRYVRPATKLSLPCVAFAVVPHTARRRSTLAPDAESLEWGWCECAVSYRRRGGWTDPLTTWTDSRDEMLAWMSARARPDRYNWVIAPSVTDTLTLLRWWQYAESVGVHHEAGGRRRANRGGNVPDVAGIRCTQFVSSGPPDILTYTDRGILWRWVGEGNYWPDGRAVGCPALDNRPVVRGGTESDRRHRGTVGASECMALLARFRGLCEWFGRVASAPLGCTAGQLAWGVLRSHLAPESLVTHTDPDAHRMEREAAHGGRASAFYVGEVSVAEAVRDAHGGTGRADAGRRIAGPVFRVDVRSMYPWLLRDRQYPVALRGHFGGIKPAALVKLAGECGVIARVQVETRAAEYPLRRAGATVYPLGTFTTVLAGPDILGVARDGRIIRVLGGCHYAMGTPFQAGIQALLSAREDATAEGDRDSAALSKLVANSLAGRLAMRAGGWARECKLDEPGRWGEYRTVSAKTGEVARYRWVFGAAYRWEREKFPAGPHTAAFAYLTAYGRQHMASLRAQLPPRSCLLQCTDGLLLTAEGNRRMTALGLLATSGAGTLREEGSWRTAEVLGARHYRLGGEWTLSGYHAPTMDRPRGVVRHSLRTPLWSTRARRAPEAVVVNYLESSIPQGTEGGTVGDDGWVIPYRILPGPARCED